jgi:hypothetical protein
MITYKDRTAEASAEECRERVLQSRRMQQPDWECFFHNRKLRVVLAYIPLVRRPLKVFCAGIRLRAGMANMGAVHGACPLRSSSADSALGAVQATSMASRVSRSAIINAGAAVAARTVCG